MITQIALTNSARTSLIPVWGLAWMWMWVFMHSVYSHNYMSPPQSIPGHENESCRQITYPTTTTTKEFQCLMPYAFLYHVSSNQVHPWVRIFRKFQVTRRALRLSLLRHKEEILRVTHVPDLTLTFTVECKMIKGTFPCA